MKIRCPICNDTNVVDLVYHQGVYRCNYCDHLFRDPPTDYSFYEKHDYWYDDPVWPNFQKTYFAFFEDYIVDGKTALEVGAANGDFLGLVFKHLENGIHSPDIFYNELKDLVSVRNNRYIPVHNRLIGPIEESLKQTHAFFNNIFLIEVLEHFKDPMLCLELLVDRLFHHGRIHIATDSGDHINSVSMMFRHPEHINIFSRDSFHVMIQTIKGFRCELKEILYWNSPVGKSYIILEKQ